MGKKRVEPAVENDILSRLDERIEKAIVTIQQLRRERDSLRQKLVEAQNSGPEVEQLREEVERFRAERDEVRERLERLVENLERLEEA